MVEVLGDDQQAKRRATCKNCAAVLEYTNSETVMRNNTDYTGVTDVWDVVVCPRCSHEQEI